jgi:hypothetical protein
MWWFILIAIGLVWLGYIFFNVIGILSIIGLVLDFFGNPFLSSVMAVVVLVIYLPMVFLILALGIDTYWSIDCDTGNHDACTYNTVFLPALHPGTPDMWTFNTTTVPVRYSPPPIHQRLAQDTDAPFQIPRIPTYGSPLGRLYHSFKGDVI